MICVGMTGTMHETNTGKRADSDKDTSKAIYIGQNLSEDNDLITTLKIYTRQNKTKRHATPNTTIKKQAAEEL
jgi:hypothetical protein